MSDQTTQETVTATAPLEAWQDPVGYLRTQGLETVLIETVTTSLEPAA